ncbi:MAG: glycine cleavage system protein GcvH [Chloroflexi bacterium]|nr:MAG: glycine cleavage system protein GcvH [Chloroflexota bacterium]
MAIPVELRYTRDHEWVLMENAKAEPAQVDKGESPVPNDLARIGITDYAQHALGDVVYVDLGAKGKRVEQFKPFGVVESVKAASDLFSPVSGEVVEVNAKLIDQPELVNSDPYGEGWMIRVRIGDVRELENLMDAGEYDAFLQTL